MTELEHVLALARAVYRGRVGHRVALPWGELLLTDDLPNVWDANLAVVDRWDGDATSLASELERACAAAGLRHRRAIVHDQALGERLWPELPVASWPWAERNLVMIRRRPPDREPPSDADVREVDVETLVRSRAPMRAAAGFDAETTRQLEEFARRIAAGVAARFFVAVVDGLVVSSCHLYREGVTAQVEDVETFPQYRNRGLARALVLRAGEEAERDGARITFLLAREDDWPQELYRRLGYEAAGVETIFGRPA